MNINKKNVFDLTYTDLEKECVRVGLPVYCAQQLCNWVYGKLVFDVSAMSNLSRNFKEFLAHNFFFYKPEIHHVAHSSSDNSYKFLLQTQDGKLVESILMIEKGRTTVCVSCMIGCPMKCKFCATGSQIGFIRKLSPSEIIGQVLSIAHYAREHGCADKITNIVYMGMGEPFATKEAVEISLDILSHQKCYALSPAKITVSTAGTGPGIAEFVEKTRIKIAISLHFPTDELRSQYMPINTHFSLASLMEELHKIKLGRRDHILIEYIMLRGINDSLMHAQQLLKLVANLKVKINLIPYNPTSTLLAEASDRGTIDVFATYLQNKGIFTSVRKSRGIDIDGGCGQFALKS